MEVWSMMVTKFTVVRIVGELYKDLVEYIWLKTGVNHQLVACTFTINFGSWPYKSNR